MKRKNKFVDRARKKVILLWVDRPDGGRPKVCSRERFKREKLKGRLVEIRTGSLADAVQTYAKWIDAHKTAGERPVLEAVMALAETQPDYAADLLGSLNRVRVLEG